MAFYMKMGSKSLKASGIDLNGSPLPKCGDPGEDPCPPSQAAADAIAEKNLRNAPKVSDGGFKETGRRKVDGGTEVSYERKYNQTGTGEARISYTELAEKGGDVEAARKWNAERNKSGKETKTRMIPDPIKLDPYGPKFMPMEIKANLDVQLPKKRFKSVEMPEVEKKTGLVGGSTTVKCPDPKDNYTKQKNLRSKFSLRRKGGCPSGRKCKGAVN